MCVCYSIGKSDITFAVDSTQNRNGSHLTEQTDVCYSYRLNEKKKQIGKGICPIEKTLTKNTVKFLHFIADRFHFVMQTEHYFDGKMSVSTGLNLTFMRERKTERELNVSKNQIAASIIF